MTLVLDAGALLAIERGDREVLVALKHELLARRAPVTHAAVVGQVWRGGAGRQAPLSRWLATITVRALDLELGRRAGVLLRRARASDVVDASLVLLAVDGDSILTSDPHDVARLAAAADLHVEVIEV